MRRWKPLTITESQPEGSMLIDRHKIPYVYAEIEKRVLSGMTLVSERSELPVYDVCRRGYLAELYVSNKPTFNMPVWIEYFTHSYSGYRIHPELAKEHLCEIRVHGEQDVVRTVNSILKDYASQKSAE